MRQAIIVVLCLIVMSWAQRAQASQCAEFELANVSASIVDYNPYDPFDATADLYVLVRRLDADVRHVHFMVVDTTHVGGAPRLGPTGPDQYDIEWPEQPGHQIFGGPSSVLGSMNDVESNFDGAPDTLIERLVMRIPRGQSLGAGRSTERLDIPFECTSATGEVLGRGILASRLRVAVRHDETFSMYFSGRGARRAAIDFGPLDVDAANSSGRIGVTVMTSLPYELTLSSQNDFHMLREGDPSSRIPYRVSVGDLAVENNVRLLCPPTAPPAGSTLDVQVDVPGPLRTQRAGSFRDVITLTFSPTDYSPALVSRCRVSGG